MAGEIKRVAVIGAGVIGASWAALFLARDYDVSVFDPAPEGQARVRRAVGELLHALTDPAAAAASAERLRVDARLEDAVADADFVQENGPEQEVLKRDTFRRMDAVAAAGVILASSSSGLPPSQIQAACVRPERVLVGHPFNPPHLVPLVEVVGGERTSEGAIAQAMAFYASVGKRPIRIRRELVGHVANRLQAALWREAFHLVDIGAVTVAEVDAAISHGPGLRWALMGPCLLNHLSGGEGGLAHTLAHLGPLMEAMWADLGTPRLTPELCRQLVAGVAEELAPVRFEAMMADRDRLLAGLVRDKAQSDLP